MARYCQTCGKKLKARDRKIKQEHLSQCRKCYRVVAQ
jgi:NAD-dependent SIR2 family protein deacetylase